MLAAAENLRKVDGNVWKTKGQDVFYVNASDYLVQDNETNKVTFLRTRTYESATCPPEMTYAQRHFRKLSLHKVQKVTSTDGLKSCYECCCCGYQANGWYCSHVIAVLDAAKDVSILEFYSYFLLMNIE
jgi:hypothetical protein